MTTRRVLLTWEYGAGRTHAEHLKAVALALKADGCDCLVLHFNTRFVGEFHALGLPSAQAPVWPARLATEIPWQSRPSIDMSDAVASLGAADPQVLAGILGHYETVFSLFRPDLVIGDWGYGAGLAARGRLPFIAMGSSSSIAPLNAIRAEPYRDGEETPAWADDELVDLVNQGLARAGRPAISRPRDLVDADRRFCLTLAECDIYGARRTEPRLPPLAPSLDGIAAAPEGEEIFIYLHAFEESNAALMAGMMTLNRPVRVYIPGLTEVGAEMLEAFGLTVEARPVPIAEIARRSRVVVHHGGGQLVAQLLALGIPQVILMKELSNQPAGHSVERLGVGRAIWHREATAGWLNDAVEACLDPAVAERARTLAPDYREILSTSPIPTIVAAAHDLMGG